MKTVASGGFSVKMTPHAWHEGAEGSADHLLSRFTLDKQYQGGLEGAADGQMLSAGDGKPGSSGVYVAIERVTGTLQGRTGSFVLYHTGIMNRGVPELKITVSPDSGTGDLAGISGSMTIAIAAGKHSYQFDYSLNTME